jgi:hypothetical protein
MAKYEGWVAHWLSARDGWLSARGWVAKSVARQLATAERIQTSLKKS